MHKSPDILHQSIFILSLFIMIVLGCSMKQKKSAYKKHFLLKLISYNNDDVYELLSQNLSIVLEFGSFLLIQDQFQRI